MTRKLKTVLRFQIAVGLAVLAVNCIWNLSQDRAIASVVYALGVWLFVGIYLKMTKL